MSHDSRSSATCRVILIGLDGGTFDLLGPLMDSGVMPNLSRLRDESAHGTLQSTNPPTTPPAWTTCTTGLNPGRHGIFDFTVSPLADPQRPLVNAQSARGLRLWNVLDNQNQRSIFVNVPVTYPPEPINGCMISGMMTPGFNSPFTHPPDLRDRLKAVCGNYIPNVDIPRYDTASDKDALQFLEDVEETLARRREAVRHLMDTEEWTVFMAVFIGLDRVLHLFAKYLFPGSNLYTTPRAQKLRPRLLDEFRRVDDVVGEMIERASDDDTVMVVSDHGFGITEGFFNANTWLLRQGLLAVKPLPYIRARLFHSAHQLGDSAFVRNALPESIQSAVRGSIRKTRSTFHSARNDLERVIDWENTKAFFGSIPCQGIYINEKTDTNPRGAVDSSDVEPLKYSIREKLLTVKHPVSGEKLADAVWFREEVFHGDQTQFAPHLVFKMKNYSVLGRQHLGSRSYFSSTQHLPIGFHRSNGMIMLRNRNVKPGSMKAEMADVMPTALYSAGLAVPDGLDGRVLLELFDEDHIRANPVRHLFREKTESSSDQREISIYDKSEQQELEDRLRSLGYLE